MARHTTLLIALSLFVSSNAAAFQPSDSVYIGIEPQRVLRTDVHTQASLQQQRDWARFTRGEGQGWMARFDQATGTPHRMWGPGIDLGPTDTADQVDAALSAFIDRNHELMGAHPRELRIASTNFVQRTHTWYVDIDVVRGGAPVYRGGITARIKHGKLIMLGVDTYPDVPVTNAVSVSRDHALATAVNQGPAAQAMHGDQGAELMTLPVQTAQGLELRVTWMTRTRTYDPPGIWVSFVDAATGELLNVHNEVRFLEGTVSGVHHERRPDGDLVSSPLQWAPVAGTGATGFTDEAGFFSIEATGPVTTDFDGDWLTVRNSAGAEASATFTGDHQWTSADATQAEIDSYVFLHQIRNWAATVAPEVRISQGSFKSYVNLDDVCNAYYDGNVNFFAAGSGCRNTGQSADVNYHEFGHGFHYWSLEAGDYDGSLGEGAADVVAFLQTGDAIIAPGFMNDGDGIRRVDRDRVWPDDFRNNEQWVHSNGLIFGGAMWDLWGLLEAEQGPEAGLQTITDIYTGLIKGGPVIETSYDEAIVADDDDGNLGNGTPNQCAIIEAFGAHGLGPRGQGSPLIAHHEPLASVSAGIDAPIAVELMNLAPSCFVLAPESAWVTYRVNGGDWQQADLDVSFDRAAGAIPQQQLGSFVEYYVTVIDEDGGEMNAPEGAHINPFSYYTGDVLQVRCDDFEDSDGGYTHELVDGDDREGADDWTWGTPQGLGGDPSMAASGNKVWGNDLGEGDYNGEYQAQKHNRLVSPELSTLHYSGVFLSYSRWLTVEDGFYDNAFITADNQDVWTNHGTNDNQGDEHHVDRQWSVHNVDLGNTTADGQVQLTWNILSDQGLQMGGWNVDDICLLAPNTPDNRLGVNDFQANPSANTDGVDLTWTNPAHAPLTELVLVRKKGSYPDGPNDGKQIWSSTAPELGAPVSITDPDVRDGRAYHYAVYTSDGENWLSWTVEGWNADVAGSTADATVGGCGCATSPDPRFGWLVLGLAGLLVRRRR